MKLILLTFFCCLSVTLCHKMSKVAFIIMSQPHKRHAAIAEETSSKLIAGLKEHGVEEPTVLTSHKDLPIHGAWTYFPLFNELLKKCPYRIKWFVFLEENAEVNVPIFSKMLSKYRSHDETFIGHALTDAKETIVHRFIEIKIGYPDIAAGFILSRELMMVLEERLEEVKKEHIWGNIFIKEFSMDAVFELAQAMRTLGPKQSGGPSLEHEPLLCTVPAKGCAIYPRKRDCPSSQEGSRKLLKETLFAIKTCTKFHHERLPILKATWVQATRNVIFVSDTKDANHGTMVLPGADFNSDSGHCLKTEAILNYFAENYQEKGWRWLVVTDDDTLLSVSKLLELVQCYDDDEEDFIALAQIYGFRVIRPRGQDKFDFMTEGNKNGGYDYQAGGGGMVFNRKLVLEILSHEKCKCPSATHHDDIHLGACLDNLGIPIIRNERFHQARPEDYNKTLLERQDPISFHKFWGETDPFNIYDTWFRKSDEHLLETLMPKEEL